MSNTPVDVDPALVALAAEHGRVEEGRAAGADDEALCHVRRPVQGMTCAACAGELMRSLSAVQGIRGLSVNTASQWVDLEVSNTADIRGLVDSANEALAPLGYRLLDDDPRSQRNASLRSLRRSLFRLLLAALMWMQIMMYAWPEYGAAAELSQQDSALLRWAQWMLSLPLMLFCARPVLQSAWRGIRRARPGLDVPAAFALIAAFVVSTQATFSGEGPVWFDSLSMFLLFLLLARHLSEWLRHRALEMVLSGQADMPERVDVERNGHVLSLSPDELRSGDVCCLQAGDVIAADAILLDAEAWVSEGVVTGEDRPVLRYPGERLLCGSKLLSANARYRVEAAGADSTLGQIARQLSGAVSGRSATGDSLDSLAIPVLVGIALSSLLAGAWAYGQHAESAWSVALAVLMVSCPCAISIAAPAARLSVAMFLRERGIVLRDPEMLKRLATVTDVVFDKTGTLTVGETVDSLQWVGEPDAKTRASLLNTMSRMAFASMHPLSRAIVAYAGTDASYAAASESLIETPGCGLQWAAPDGQTYRLGKAQWCGVPEQMAQDGHAKGLSTVWLSHGIGLGDGWLPLCEVRITAHLREGAALAVRQFRAEGIQVHLWSGDKEDAVVAVAERLGISQARALQSPHDKLNALRKLQAAKRRVMVIGDGLNDAPVIAGSDASLVLASGSRLTQMQADAVLVRESLDPLIPLIGLSHRLRRVIRQNMAWAIAYNIVAVPLAATSFLTPLSAGVGMAFSSIVVLLNAMRLLREPSERSVCRDLKRESFHGYSVSADTAVGGAGICDRGGIGVERECGTV